MSRKPEHPNRVIYLDYHASSPVDPRVMAAMAPYFTEFFGNPHATEHSEGWRAHEAIDAAARKIATALGTDPDEIIFTSGATESNNLAILGIARRAPLPRQRILVSSIEHKCVLAAARMAASFGLTVELIPVDRDGFIDLDDLRERLRPDVLLVSVMAVNNEIGTIQPIREIARHAHAVGALMHTDASQALAAGPLNVALWDVDLLSLSAHKIYGPKGIGLLVIRRDIQDSIEPLMYGGEQQQGLRSGTLPVPLCVGLAEAVALMTGEGAGRELQRLRSLRDALIAKLHQVDERIQVNGPESNARHSGNANLRFPGLDARDLLAALQPCVAASTGSACISGIEESSHVLRAIGLSSIEADSSVRFCVGRFTVEEDIDEAVSLIRSALQRLKAQGS
jgi:cysteine desulfurase